MMKVILILKTFELYDVWGSKSLSPTLWTNANKGLNMFKKGVCAKQQVKMKNESGGFTFSKPGFPQENLHVTKSEFPT